MDPIPSYPVADFGPAMKGMVIGAVGILHVFLAQFAIGGGFLMLAFERTSQRATDPVLKDAARRFVAGYFKKPLPSPSRHAAAPPVRRAGQRRRG